MRKFINLSIHFLTRGRVVVAAVIEGGSRLPSHQQHFPAPLDNPKALSGQAGYVIPPASLRSTPGLSSPGWACRGHLKEEMVS